MRARLHHPHDLLEYSVQVIHLFDDIATEDEVERCVRAGKIAHHTRMRGDPVSQASSLYRSDGSLDMERYRFVAEALDARPPNEFDEVHLERPGPVGSRLTSIRS